MGLRKIKFCTTWIKILTLRCQYLLFFSVVSYSFCRYVGMYWFAFPFTTFSWFSFSVRTVLFGFASWNLLYSTRKGPGVYLVGLYISFVAVYLYHLTFCKARFGLWQHAIMSSRNMSDDCLPRWFGFLSTGLEFLLCISDSTNLVLVAVHVRYEQLILCSVFCSRRW